MSIRPSKRLRAAQTCALPIYTWMVQGGIPMGNCQYNANSQILTCTDSSNDVYTTVETATSGTAGQWVDYIAPTGIPHTSQPAFAQISGTASASQLPGLPGV